MRPIQSLDPAIERTRVILFRPFRFIVWVHLAVIIFIERLFQGSGGSYTGNFGGQGQPGTRRSPTETARDFAEQATTFVTENLLLVAVVLTLGLLVALVLVVLFAWLRSRGQLMFVRALALSDTDIGRNWRETRSLSGSLFLFRVVVDLLGAGIGTVFAAVGVFMFLHQIADESLRVNSFAFWQPFLWLIAALTLFSFTYRMTLLLLRDFVVPLMYRFGLSCGAAWSAFNGIAWPNFWRIAVYYHVRVVIALVSVAATLVAGCFTLCVGFLPVVHHGLLAPVYVFERAYSIYLIESLGPSFRIVQDVREEIDPFGEGDPRDLNM